MPKPTRAEMDPLRLSTAIAAAWDSFEAETGDSPGDDEKAHIAADVARQWFGADRG